MAQHQNNNNNNNNTNKTTQQANKHIDPCDEQLTRFINPSQDLHNITPYPGFPEAIQLPKNREEMLNLHFTPFPEGFRYIMSQVAIPGVTQLDEKMIKNPLWKHYDETPMIDPLEDCEFLHLLFNHPREDQYNTWRFQWIAAPRIYSVHILIALHKLQLAYTAYATKPKGTPTCRQYKTDMRLAWRELPDAVQQWVLQILAPKPKQFTPMLSDKHYHTTAMYFPDEEFIVQKENKKYVKAAALFWFTHWKNNFRLIDVYPHEADKHDNQLTDKQLSEKWKQRNQPKQQQQQRNAANYNPTQNVVNDVTQATPAQLINNNNLPRVMDPRLAKATTSDENASKENDTNLDTQTSGATAPTNSHTQTTQTTENSQNANKQDTPPKSQSQLAQPQPKQLPPTPPENYCPIKSVYYWDSNWEKHRRIQWRLEKAYYELQQQGELDSSKWQQVYNRAHAGGYSTFSEIKHDLQIKRSNPAAQAYAPVRGPTKQWQATTTEPYERKEITETQRHTTTPSTATAVPPLPTNVPRANDIYTRAAHRHNPALGAQYTYYNNPKSSTELANNIATAFATNTIPPRVHNEMPRDPTGTVNLPAPPTTPVDTRYPTIENQTFYNLTSSQLTDADVILGQYRHGVPQNARARARPTNDINTSLVEIP